MKKIIGKSAALISAVCLLFVSQSFPTPGKASAAPDEFHDDWLHVNENAQIVDMDGNPVWLTGCNWFGYNTGSQVFDGVWSLNMHWALNEIADHGFNLLRVPMSTELILGWKNGDPDPMCKVNTYSNPELTVDGVEGSDPMYSLDIWNLAVKWCRENGIKIMMDIHSAETASAGHQYPVWYTDKFSTDDWLEALSWFADYYKDDDTIIAIDLKNEPHGKRDEGTFAKWDGSTDDNNWRYAAERGAQAVLSKNPNLLIMVEGIEVYPKFEKGFDWNSPSTDYAHYGDPEYQPYHGTWWGGNFRGAKEYPVDLGEHQDKLVYSPHDYGPLVFDQSWFYDGFDGDTLMKDCWYDNWFFLQDTKTAPLLMGEWGGFLDKEHDEDGRNRKWMAALRDLMIEKHINHTFWCFNENSGDTGGLIAGGTNWTEWDEEKYEFVEPSLWQDEAGRYISLDHKRPVGKNGISVTEYYSGTAPVLPTTTPTEPTTKPVVTTTTAPTTSAPATTAPSTEATTKATETSVSTDVTTLPVITTNGAITAPTTASTAATTASAPTAAPSTGGPDDADVRYGDVNRDGAINIADVVKVNKYLLNSEENPLTPAEYTNADCMKDGSVDSSDSTMLMNYVSMQIPESALGAEQ